MHIESSEVPKELGFPFASVPRLGPHGPKLARVAMQLASAATSTLHIRGGEPF